MIPGDSFDDYLIKYFHTIFHLVLKYYLVTLRHSTFVNARLSFLFVVYLVFKK